MTNHMQTAIRSDQFADLGERRRMVVHRDVIQVESVSMQVVVEPVAHPKIEREDVAEFIVVQIVHEVVVLRHDEHVAGGRQPVNDEHHIVARLALKTQQAQAELVARLNRMCGDLRVPNSLGGESRNLPLIRSDRWQMAGTVDLP